MKKLIIAVVILASTSSAFAADKNQQWIEYINWAARTSAAQNNGKAAFHRICQPELKACNEAIWYKDKMGTETMVREMIGLNGQAISRDVCRFNNDMDVRTCVDWYSERMTTEMKDKDGRWILI